MRHPCLSLCLTLALLAGSANSQGSSDTISLDLFLPNMTFSGKDGLKDNTSQVYEDMTAKVKEYLSPIGGQTDGISFSDSGGCVKVNIIWRNGNQTTLAEVTDKLQKDGFMIWGQTYTVSFTGCAVATALTFKFYVEKLPWTDSYKDHTSMEYQQMIEIVTALFSDLGGNIRALEIQQNTGCVQFHVEWNALNSTKILELTSALTANGITIKDQKYSVQNKPCSAKPTLLKYTFYVPYLPWSENYTNKNSPEYKSLLGNMENAFINLGGKLWTLEVIQNFNCVQFYVEWETVKPSSIMNLTTNGIMINDQKYAVQSRPCTLNFTVLRVKFYVVNMTWSDSFTQSDSTNYTMLKETLQKTFSTLGGQIRSLEIAKNYNCLEVYIEWEALNHLTIMDYFSVLKRDGIIFMDQTYAVQAKPCEIPATEVDECPEVPKGTYSDCAMACNDSDAQKKCLDGFKCCFNGCGRTCRRVDYTLKMNATIVVSGIEGMDVQESAVFSQLEAAVKELVLRNFNVEIPSLIGDVELTNVGDYRIQNQPLSLLDVVLYFHEDVPNTDLVPCRIRLMREGSSIGNFSFKIIDLRLGLHSVSPVSICDGMECFGICKELRSYMQYCSCDPGYVGPDCATFDCRTDTDPFAVIYESLCQNGGECVQNPKELDFKCQCLPGYYGALCQVNLSSCPSVTKRRPGLYGLCQSECHMGDDCGVDKKCCRHLCGGDVCVEVGYHQKLQARITLDFPFTSELKNTSSEMYEIMKTQLEIWLNSKIKQFNIGILKEVTIKRFNSSKDGQVAKRKRDNGNTVIEVELLFTEDTPVEDMNVIKDKIMADGFSTPGTIWKVLNITYGTEGCPHMACAPGSFCVTNFGGEVQCACPKGKSGQLCDVMNCKPAGTNLCQNGGQCTPSANLQMECRCPTGFKGKFCEEANNPCGLGRCINGGICHNLPDGNHYCECPPGFSGSVCENAATHCLTGKPLMTTSGERECRTQACPFGFSCNADPLDRWTACCFREDSLCELNPCKAGGLCVANFSSGTVCRCPQGRKGLFCEEASTDMIIPTACQTKQQFNDWVISILGTGTSSLNITKEDLRLILQHLGYQYIPTDLCDQNGNFKSVTQGVLVVNPSAAKVNICIDKNGNHDPGCTVAICDVLSNRGSTEFCLNGGKCLGEITQQLCDCSGTGYHGVRCELKEGGPIETNCTLRRDIAYMAIGILNGFVDPNLGLSKETNEAAVKEVLKLYNSNNIFVPYCDNNGQYEYRGCLYMVEDASKKTCYCALDDGTIFGKEESPIEPPPNCRKDSCPKEWGEECVQPDWWCSQAVQCQPDTERCAYYTRCTDDMCSLKPEAGCVAKGSIVLPCDPQPCKDDPFSMCQPCGTHGSCFNLGSVNESANMGYKCQCKMQFSGPECEINENICSVIPRDFCESNCIGDLRSGQLCQCDPGYGGLFCDKPARRVCEKRKALYDDAFYILNGRNGSRNIYSTAEVKSIVRLIIQIDGGDGIPILDCTGEGFYDKIQCMVSVNNLEDRKCYCVDYYNKPISSNVEPYIGFDVCTAPSDTRDLVPTACNAPEYFDAKELSVCQNGGTCIFDIYAGKFCSCPDGYYGLFCQYRGGDPESEPRSLCEFFAKAWDIAHTISTVNVSWITNEMQKNLYLNLTSNFLQIQGNLSYGLKSECHDDGTFKPAACYYHLISGEKGSCKCWNLRGPNVEGPLVDNADSEVCSDMRNIGCPLLKCKIVCEHGYRLDNTGCRTCDCKNPCEDVSCEWGTRCVIEMRSDCAINDRQLTCSQAVCRPADKPGACPGYSAELYGPAQGALLDAVRNMSSCNPTCFDDTDCEGNKKCCGLCNNTCMEPQGTSSCMDYESKMRAHLSFIKMARDELRTTRELSLANIRMFERITDLQYIWIPSCTEGGTVFAPLQCQNFLDISGIIGNVSSCFCVDVYGTKVEGANASVSDPASCDIKPFTCPAVEPSQRSEEREHCNEDLECVGGKKCCGKLDKTCLAPVDTSKLLTTLDMMLSTLCEKNSQMCQGGTQCVSSWFEAGIVCQCPSDRVGPFCEQIISDGMKKPNTACERKKFAVDVFAQQLGKLNSSLSFNKLLNSAFDYSNMKIKITSAVGYDCTADGAFQPKQCVVNVANGMSPIECFCVYEDGVEILGTRTSVDFGRSLFCGENNMTCPLGTAYRKDNGEILQCESGYDCPVEYACRRSTYGKQYCCPTKESTCPATPVKVQVRSQCPDQCKANSDCDVNYLCCSSTCGKRCIPTGGAIVGNICPIGQPRDALLGGMCNKTRLCETGYMCVMKEQSGNSAGVCCPDYSNVDQCLVPPTTQHMCQKSEDRYFYNATSKMCEKFKFGGCDPDFNNFRTLEECCQNCSSEDRCKMGRCPRVNSGSVGICVTECHGDGDCPGQTICCTNGCGATCVVPDAMTESNCLTQQMEAKRSQRMRKAETNNSTDCYMITIPECEEDGTWARMQCQIALGICYCVTPKEGNYIKDSLTKGVPQCQTVTDSMIMKADQLQYDISKETYSVCDNGKDVHCCSKAICSQKCWAYPEAVCRINPCGGCSAEYYSTDGRLVNCNEGLSTCQQKQKEATMAVQEHEINAAIARGEDLDTLYNFASKKSSEQTSKSRSLNTAYPERCQLPPVTGPCKGFQEMWYFDPVSGHCKMFIWGMCDGNENRFNSPEDCYKACSPSSNPCMEVSCNATDSVCKLQFVDNCYLSDTGCNMTAICTSKDPAPYLVQNIFVPSCEATGEYSYKQCNGNYCWCVDSTGQYINGLTVEQSSSLICTASGTSQTITPLGSCPNGNPPNIACMNACTSKVCPGQPGAVCVVDLCSSNCNTMFVDKSGKEVTCTGDVCKVFRFKELEQCTDNVPCPGTSVKTCPASICEQALAQNCSKNPCAVCMVNPCTCQPYFIHAKTSARLSEAECNYLYKGICERETCKTMNKNMALTSADTNLPDCDDNGIYIPRQCQGSKCYCVDQKGVRTTENAETSCDAIDKIKRFKVTFTFEADFNTLKSRNKLQTLVDMLKNKLKEAGIDIKIIKYIGEPYEGSVKVDVTFENTEDSNNKDMALILNVLEQMDKMGELNLTIDGQTVPLTNMTKEVKTESQVAKENEGNKSPSKDSEDMLTRTEKIIIGVVCGCVGLLIIGIISFCLCCRKRKQKEAMDDSFEHVREGKKSTQQGPIPVYNQVFEDDEKSIKVRL